MLMLIGERGVTNAGHERGNEAGVVEDHPANVHEDAVLERCGWFAGGRVGGFGFGNSLDLGGDVVAAGLGGSDWLLKTAAGEDSEDTFGDNARGEDEAGHGAEASCVDEARGGKEDEGGNEIGKRVGEMDGYTTAERIANDP